MSTARNGDVEIHYETFGDPERPALVLVNGLGSQSINFSVEMCEQFAAEGYRVIRFDNRDTGLSSKLEGVDYTLADMAGDLLAVLDAESVEQAHVLGTSMGGMHAWLWGEEHPEFADALMPLASVPGPMSGRNREWRRLIIDAIRNDPS
ncbi:MAG: alpha/beta fold hydrolase, partial [Acidimicrobiia bacterium]|nr:alpha/beta fold hydrolase [Acidimicrobiia bacterium]